MNLGCHRPAVRDRVLRRYGRLDAVVTLTATDLAGYRRELPDARRLVCIPNALPELNGGPADPAARTVLAAGRLVRQKGFDLLLDAGERVAADHPGWTLRIYGGGPWRQRLQRRIDRRGLSSSAFLMGRTDDIGTAMAKASIFVLSSRYEGLPLVLLEAMSKGLGVVSFDCPTGPRELLTDGVDGLLVKEGDVPALAAAIGRMMDDEGLRARLGEQAVGAMARYTPEAVGAEWDALLDDLVRPVPARRAARPRVPEKEAGLL
jgi:glycosyltransferase involved in cell wall biosynthesis